MYIATLRNVGSCLFGLRQARRYVSDVVFRQATPLDKMGILSIRQDCACDYLPAYFDYYIQHNHTHFPVGFAENTAVVTGVAFLTDDGLTLSGVAGRVHKEYTRQGLLKKLLDHLQIYGMKNGITRMLTMVDYSNRNELVHSESYMRTRSRLDIRMMFSGIIEDPQRRYLLRSLSNKNILPCCHSIDAFQITQYLNVPEVRKYLFPTGYMLVDSVPYQASPINVKHLHGRNTVFYTSVRESEGVVNGVLSSGTLYNCENLPEYHVYAVDLFGTNHSELEQHVILHMKRALEVNPGPLFWHVFVESDRLSALQSILIKYGIKGDTTPNAIMEHKY